MNPALMPIIIMDVYKQLAPQDKDYFRASREQRFGKPLEQVKMSAPDAPCHVAHVVASAFCVHLNLCSCQLLLCQAPGPP